MFKLKMLTSDILDNLLKFVIDVAEIKSGELADEFKSTER